MPLPQAPVDTSVVVPASVRRAAEKANAVHAAAYGVTQPEPTPAPAPADGLVNLSPEPAPQPAPQPAPAPQPEPQPAPAPQPQPAPAPQPEPQPAPAPQPENWEHRYHAMRGRHDQALGTIGSMQQQMGELGDELLRAQQRIATLESGTAPAPQPGQPARTMITDKDREVYGEELLGTIARVAREAVAPDLAQTQNQVRQVGQRVAQTATQGVYLDLDREVADWRVINKDPRFKVWCQQPDIYSGELRGTLLNRAFKAANAPRLAQFFKGFLAEEQATGNLPQPQTVTGATVPLRQPAVSMDTLVAPGRAKPAGGDQQGTPSADKPVYTRKQISDFYDAIRKGQYIGREPEKAKTERDIFAAQAEGRVR